MTPLQLELLVQLCDANTGARFVRGPKVTAARRLQKAGLCVLEDQGELRAMARSDGERWWCTVTDLGRATLRGIREAAAPRPIETPDIERDAEGRPRRLFLR